MPHSRSHSCARLLRVVAAPRSMLLPLLSTVAMLGLSGCDLLGIEGATAVAAKRDAEGRAVGAGCRQGARSVEQCYGLNKRADKAAVFAGWRDMNDYMRENKLEAMPTLPDPEQTLASASEAGEVSDDLDKAVDPAAKTAKTARAGKSAR